MFISRGTPVYENENKIKRQLLGHGDCSSTASCQIKILANILRHICNFCGLLKQLCVLYNPIFSAEPCFGSTAVNIPCLGGTVSRGMAVPSPNFGARGGGCSTPQRGCFTAGKEPPYPIYRRLAGPQGLCGRVWRRKGLFSPPGVEQKVMITLILGIIV